MKTITTTTLIKRPRSIKQWERAMQEMADRDTELRLSGRSVRPRRGRPIRQSSEARLCQGGPLTTGSGLPDWDK
jgi:hypothetical protein